MVREYLRRAYLGGKMAKSKKVYYFQVFCILGVMFWGDVKFRGTKSRF